MTTNVGVLPDFMRICLYIAAFCATLVPAIYAFAPWYLNAIGRAFMLQSVSFALVLDATVIFQFWVPEDIRVLYWVEAAIFFLISISTLRLAALMIKIKLHPKKGYFRD